MVERVEELMCLGKWGSQTLSLDYCGGMSHLHFRWVSSVRLSGLYRDVRSGVKLHLEGMSFVLVLQHLFTCCFSMEVWHTAHLSLSSIHRS